MTKEYDSLLEEVQKKGGDLKNVTIEIPNTETHKIGDNYIKVGCILSYECALKENADVNAVTDALDAYTRAKGNQSLADQKQEKGISTTAAPLQPEQAATVAQVPTGHPSVPPPNAPSPVATPPVAVSTASQGESPYVVLKNPHIARTDDGRAKIFGQTEEYNWTRWGVHIWHEVLDAAVEGAPTLANWRQWPLCKGGKDGFPDGEGSNRYALPDGLTEAVVLMKLDDGKWKPDKVTELR